MERPVEIAIVSGKGGTGKTLIASSIARLTESLVVVDCDMEAPSLHLRAEPLAIDRGPVAGDCVAIIDDRRCSRCGECLKACRFEAVRERDVPEGWSYSVVPQACEGCGACLEVCPDAAVRLLELPAGAWCVSASPLGPVVYAVLQNPPRNGAEIVRVLRREARRTAAKRNLRRVLVDGPAGIGATAIESVLGVSLAVVIAEPTLSGIYDLRRMIDLLSRLGIRMAGVINRADLNPGLASEIVGYMQVRDLVLLGSIAYSDDIARADSAGEFPADLSGVAAADDLRTVARLILDSVEG